MTSTLTLFVDHLSQPCRALSLLCRTIKVQHHEKYVQLIKGEHLRQPFAELTPFRKIPVVQDGNLLILESCAALRYIADKYDTSNQWYPKPPSVRAKVDEYLDWQHTNTRAHGVGYFTNKVLFPFLKKTPPDLKAISEHSKELDRVEKQFTSYFLGPRPFITGDSPTIADLVAACEFEQPLAGGHQLSPPVMEFLGRVKSVIGPEYEDLHNVVRKFANKVLS